MSPSRDSIVAVPQTHRPPSGSVDGLDEYAGRLHPEESTLLGSEDIHSALTEEEDEDHIQEIVQWKKLSWWKRPSPYWMILGIPLGSMGSSATFAPRVDIYTTLVCRLHRPEYISTTLAQQFALYEPLTVHSADQLLSHVHDGSDTALVDTPFVFLPNSTDFSTPHYTPNGSDGEQQCASDPVVQAAVARLNAVLMPVMGILACVTTGWWGSLSDRFGRRTIIWISMFGLLATEVIHIITALFVDVLPGGYWFLLVGYLMEGLCGGMPTASAISYAYIADTTEPSTRSRYFSLSLGFMFAGVAVGPVLGGVLIRLTGTTLSAYYFAAALHGLYIMLILVVLPESLTRARARGARLRRGKERADERHDNRAIQIFRSTTKFLSPLVVLLPRPIKEANPLRKGRRDWSLFCIAIAYGLSMSIMGSLPYRYQYAAAQFKWSSEIISYYIAATGAVRATFLALVLPVILKYLNPPIQLASAPNEPLQSTMGLSATNSSSEHLDSPQRRSSDSESLSTSSDPSHSVKFELQLARASVWMEIISYLSTAVSATGVLFAFTSFISAFGGGAGPAMQAIALEVYARLHHQGRGEAGKVFGALSVVQALSSQIISPAVYGFVYSTTVSTFPQALMIVSAFAALGEFTALMFIRIPPKLSGVGFTPRNEDIVDRTEAAPEILAMGTEETRVEG